MIVLIIGHFLTFVKFRSNIKIPGKRANSVARLEIPRPAENCEPYLSVLTFFCNLYYVWELPSPITL